MTVPLPHPITNPVPQYHSKTAYSIPSDEADAIIRTSAYHRTDFDRAVIWFAPRAHTNGVTSLSASREPTNSLGELDKPPLELISEICLQLDIASLFYLRQVNARARQIVDTLHEYKTIITHALDPFCALLRTHSASRVTLSNFYRLLCTQNCSVCNERYGDLVYLPTWIRCCSCCVRSSPSELRVATLTSIKRVFRPSKGALTRLPTLTTVPGIYYG